MKSRTVIAAAIAAAVLLLVMLGIFFWMVSSGAEKLARALAEEELPGLSFASFEVGWGTVHLTDVRFQPPETGKTLLEAKTVAASPSVFSFLTDTLQISEVKIVGLNVHLERDEAGRLLIPVPSGPAPEGPGPQTEDTGTTRLAIHSVRIVDGAGDFTDRFVEGPPAVFHLNNIQGTLSNLEVPQESTLNMYFDGNLQSADTPAAFRLDGDYDPSPREAELSFEIEDADLSLFTPYFGRNAPIESGTLSSPSNWELAGDQYLARGILHLNNLSFSSGSQTFLGIPAGVVQQFLQEEGQEISIPFEVAGTLGGENVLQLDLPSLLQETLMGRIQESGLSLPGNLEELKDPNEVQDRLEDLFR